MTTSMLDTNKANEAGKAKRAGTANKAKEANKNAIDGDFAGASLTPFESIKAVVGLDKMDNVDKALMEETAKKIKESMAGRQPSRTLAPAQPPASKPYEWKSFPAGKLQGELKRLPDRDID